MISLGHLTYVKGNRVTDAHLGGAGGLPVIGPAELLDPTAVRSRWISLLDFTAACPAGRLTEPGDVVFCTSPRPAAMVDAYGGAVVVFPARILRIDAGDPGGLVPAVAAADINGVTPGDKNWRQWRLRRAPDAARRPLEAVLAALQHEQREARQRVARLEELATLILDGVAGGSLTLRDPDSIDAAPPSKGTR